MSEWIPVVTNIKNLVKHPNADTLAIATVFDDYQCIVKDNEFFVGEQIAFIPINTKIPSHKDFENIKAKKVKITKIRGVYSHGLIIKAPHGFKEGDSLVEYYGLKKVFSEAEIQEDSFSGFKVVSRTNETESPPKNFEIPYYDLPSLRAYAKEFTEEDDVVITEKIEGCHFDAVHDGEKLWVKSRNLFKRKHAENLWWDAAIRFNLENILAKYPTYCIMCELYGQVKHFRYDANIVNNKIQTQIAMFDVYDIIKKEFLSWDKVVEFSINTGIKITPVLYEGKWKTDKSLYELAEGKSVIGENIKEGFVMRTKSNNCFSDSTRKIVKLKGQDYLMKS